MDISGKISLQCMKVFKRKTQFCMLLTPVFPGRKRGGLKFTDEPTGALDEDTGNDVMKLFQRLKMKNRAIIIVTHDSKVAEYCDRIVYLRDGANV